VIFLFFHLNPTVQITIVGERRRTEDLSEKRCWARISSREIFFIFFFILFFLFLRAKKF